MFDIGLIASFGAGVVSFLSPCILPLVPPYLCFLAGTSLTVLSDNPSTAVSLRALARAAAFVTGFSVVFVALGASASSLGQIVSDHLTWLSRIAGGAIALLGLHMLGLFRWSPLMRQARFEASRPASFLGAFVVGLAFGFGWTPCVGPVLASILLLAGAQDSVGHGAALLSAYAGGIGLPFMAAALFTGPFLNWVKRFRHHLGTIEKAMGAILLLTGLTIALGWMPAVGNWLVDAIPALGRLG